jgi:hypothetical protein
VVEVHRRQLAAALFYGLSTRHICAVEVYVYYLYISREEIDRYRRGLGTGLGSSPLVILCWLWSKHA